MNSQSIKRVFLGWDRPLNVLATERIFADQGIADGILDYSKVLFFLPTSQSCRRFRRNITKYANSNNAVVFPGRITTLSTLISNLEERDDVINSSASFMLWVDVLREAQLEALRALFPLDLENQKDIKWRIGLAEKLFGLQNRLGEVGLTIQDVAEMDIEEIDRWQNLASLESEYLARLADGSSSTSEKAGLTELNRAKRDYKDYSFPGIERIIVAGVPDPIPLLVEKLKIISEDIPVEIWIHAPESESDKFDEFGRPIEQYWEGAEINIPQESWLHLSGTSRQQGEEVVEIVKKLQNVEGQKVGRSEGEGEEKKTGVRCQVSGENSRSTILEEEKPLSPSTLTFTPEGNGGIDADSFAICIANEELYSDISYAFFKHGISVYDPSGTTMDKMSVYHLLNSFSGVVKKRDFESLSQLIRNPDYLRYFIKKSGVENILEIFTSVDNYLVDHMSTSIASLPEFEEDQVLNYLVCEVKHLMEEFNSSSFFSFIRRFLADTYDSLEFSPHTREEDHIFCSAAKNVDNLLKELEGPMGEQIKKDELLEVFIKLLRKGTVYPEKPEDSLDLQGWLEISWENAPNIIISGMNEGWLPESVVGDVFLPDGMLSQLGLKDNRKRFARDTYILHSLLKSRSSREESEDPEGQRDKAENEDKSLSLSPLTSLGSVHMIVGKQNKSSDPIKPSRLLFKCDKERLVERSEHLFSDVPEDKTDQATAVPLWQLKKPDLNQDIKRVSVTEFRNYLSCPFRFYLRKCMKMEDVMYENNEMDARDFGTITHAVLEDFGRESGMVNCADAGKIKEFLDKNVEAHFNKKFGPKEERPLPILVQYESLKQRLAKFAEIQAEQVEEGWKIIGTELKIGGEFNGIYISGKIDRVELNSRTGKIRILDYKTVDSGDINKLSPAKVHVKNANDIAPECAIFDYDGKNKCWIDMQLPLYALLLRDKDEYKDKSLECGYFNLHKTISHTGIYIWDDMTGYLGAAEECVGKVLENLNNKVFWPPSEKVQYENYGRIYAGYKTLEEAFEDKV